MLHELRLLERVETEIVGRACASLVSQELFSAPPRMRERAEQIAATEAGHALECHGLIAGLIERGPDRLAVAAGQAPMPSFVDAVAVVARREDRPSLVYLFAAVVTESLGAGRLRSAAGDPALDRACVDFFEDHASEELDHAALFADVCRIAWQSLDGADQGAVLGYLPRLLDCYVLPSRANCTAILEDADFDFEDAERIVSETYSRSVLGQIVAPQVSVAMKVFARAGMLDTPEARRAFGGYLRTQLP